MRAVVPVIKIKREEHFLVEDVTEKILSYYERKGSPLRPFYGQKVSCGLFGISDDFIEKYQSLDAQFIKNKVATFFFEATGDSMEPFIFSGDVLVVDRSVNVQTGHVAVLSVNGEMICKRLLLKKGSVTLTSDNSIYEHLKVREEMNLVIFGAVIAIVRKTI